MQNHKIEHNADEPTNHNENDQRSRCGKCLATIVQIGCQPGTASSSNKNDEAVGEQNFIENWNAKEWPENLMAFFGSNAGMDHDIVLFAELYSSVYNTIVAVVSMTCQIKGGLPENQVESS